ncbi:Disintegrin and metalloproteinase domain-containing protein 9 [Halotydeus destructor]|nr:Disintegrin and metalloproteinase domain-containing protein 9 [Halotydeus destructor]
MRMMFYPPCWVFVPISFIVLLESSHQVQFSDNKLTCGNDETYRPLADPGRQRSLDHPVRYVRMFVVADYELYRRFFKSSESSMIAFIVDLVTVSNKMLATLNLHIILSHAEVWTDRDRIGRQANMSRYHQAATDYQEKQLYTKYDYDTIVFITGNFYPVPPEDALVIGRAWMGQICRDHSAMVAMFPYNDRGSNYTAQEFGMVIVHELGHILGMPHDTIDCSCPEKTCVMQPSLSDIPAWTECSRQRFEDLAWKRKDVCYQRPNNTGKYAICGNGIVEDGEQCDCHHRDALCKLCCSATSCRLTKAYCITTPVPSWDQRREIEFSQDTRCHPYGSHCGHRHIGCLEI